MCKMFAAAGKFSSLSMDKRAKFHEFMSQLYYSTEFDSQDQDAAGFYSWGGDRRQHDRLAGDSRHFVSTSKQWHGVRANPQLLYLCHARGAMSDASNPENNHPFVGENVALMHEGWISNYADETIARGLSLTTETDSEFYMRLADQRRPSLGDRNEWDAVKCMAAMLRITSEPTALALIDHSSRHPHIWFGKNEAAEHSFHFSKIKYLKGVFLTSTMDMMVQAGYLSFLENAKDIVKEIDIKIEPFTVYKMDSLHETITEYK